MRHVLLVETLHRFRMQIYINMITRDSHSRLYLTRYILHNDIVLSSSECSLQSEPDPLRSVLSNQMIPGIGSVTEWIGIFGISQQKMS